MASWVDIDESLQMSDHAAAAAAAVQSKKGKGGRWGGRKIKSSADLGAEVEAEAVLSVKITAARYLTSTSQVAKDTGAGPAATISNAHVRVVGPLRGETIAKTKTVRHYPTGI